MWWWLSTRTRRELAELRELREDLLVALAASAQHAAALESMRRDLPLVRRRLRYWIECLRAARRLKDRELVRIARRRRDMCRAEFREFREMTRRGAPELDAELWGYLDGYRERASRLMAAGVPARLVDIPEQPDATPRAEQRAAELELELDDDERHDVRLFAALVDCVP